MTATTRISGCLLAAVALTLLPRCVAKTESASCTLLGCGPALRVDLLREAWEPGDYQIDVTADGVATSCTVSLPLSSCSNLVHCDRADPGFFVETSGCALPAAQQEIPGIVWPTSGPSNVTVKVQQDGVLLGSGSFQPTYNTSQPNGEGCEPTCSQSDLQATIDLP